MISGEVFLLGHTAAAELFHCVLKWNNWSILFVRLHRMSWGEEGKIFQTNLHPSLVCLYLGILYTPYMALASILPPILWRVTPYCPMNSMAAKEAFQIGLWDLPTMPLTAFSSLSASRRTKSHWSILPSTSRNGLKRECFRFVKQSWMGFVM